MITREEALAILYDYLEGRITKAKVHRWALNIVVSDEFDKLRAIDELLAETVHALFDLHHQGEEERFDPTIEELEYYKNCLEGKIEFTPSERRKGKREKGKGGHL
ncbi:MAG: hypothetical protein HZC12_00180 [Nitrospirae bacterium]|nr:hypothetical protein [Nitrospirota bacterium]